MTIRNFCARKFNNFKFVESTSRHCLDKKARHEIFWGSEKLKGEGNFQFSQNVSHDHNQDRPFPAPKLRMRRKEGKRGRERESGKREGEGGEKCIEKWEKRGQGSLRLEGGGGTGASFGESGFSN